MSRAPWLKLRREAEMQIIGVDLHTRQQTVAMLHVETGEVVEKTLR
jgi:hypothetical protein